MPRHFLTGAELSAADLGALLERRAWGLTYARVTFPDAAQQAYFATSVLPLVRDGERATSV